MGHTDHDKKVHFYEIISEMNANAERRMVTVVDGACAGEKAVLSSGASVWNSCGDGFLKAHEDRVRQAPAGGLTDIDGVRVYSEILGSETEVVICGAGHVSMQVIAIAKMMGCRVTVIDDRLQFVSDAIAHGADQGLFKEFEEGLAAISGSEDTYFVIVTRGHRYDKNCLRCIAAKPHAYIGMMGSRRRVAVVKEDLAREGVSREVLDAVHTPIGLSIGAETPEEIAVAIMAEIIEVKNRRKRSFGFPQDIMKALLSDGREPFVMATIIARNGSAPRGVGTRMLIARDGGIVGTIGGGCMEGAVIARGRRMLNQNDSRPAVIEINMSNDCAEDEGMVCGGTVKVFLEIV